MNSIPDYMTVKHRECDDLFSLAESAVVKKDWLLATTQWQLFTAELELHLVAEETILFPQFELATGISSGPTQVMRSEHQQMRALVDTLNHALAAKEATEFLGLSDTLMVLMQQHNMKEEMMLYPMSQQHIPQRIGILEQLQQHCESATV